VDLTVDIPPSASSLTGSLDGEDIRVSWHLSDNSGGDPELPASLEGTIGGREVMLRGVFRLGPGFYFDGASVEGDIGGLQLKATIERAEGGFGSTSAVAARGALADSEFVIFGAVNGSLDWGMLRGVVDREVVHVNAPQRGPERCAPVWFVSGGNPARSTCHGNPSLLPVATQIRARLLLAGAQTAYDRRS
jgi:hypothetical protein